MSSLQKFIVRILLLGLYFILPGTLTLSSQPTTGEKFPAWTDGYLDIHHINTGKGESSLFIMPDGTTLLVDAGATSRPKPRVTDPKPDGSRTPGEWISRYIQEMIPDKRLDYILLTHFHDDHMGGGGNLDNARMSKSKTYKLSGITEVGENLQFRKIIDRGWPDYNYPQPLAQEGFKNYLQFLDWQIKTNGAVAEQFKVGDNRQLALLKNPDKYPGFEIRNIAANGHVWTGFGINERNFFPPLESVPGSLPDENKCSIAFRLSYGKFDYFNGGDLTTGETGQWQDIETPVGIVTGPVEVCEVNHHAYYDAMGMQFIRSLRPRVFVMQTWVPSQPDGGVLNRILSTKTYSGPRDVFATNIMEVSKIVVGAALDNLKSQQGHIVIRVNPGGENFMIYILDDSAESFMIKSIHGPYKCE